MIDCYDGILGLGLDEEELEDDTDSDFVWEEEHSAEETKTMLQETESHTSRTRSSRTIASAPLIRTRDA